MSKGASRRFPGIRRFDLPKGLTRRAALLEAIKKNRKQGGGDFRGFTYNAQTGRATMV